MKKTRIFLVALVLAAQVAGIFCVSAARERERAVNPTFRLECRSYDPRDFLRGHYLPLDFKILREIPASKFDAAAREHIRESKPSLRDEIARDDPKRGASGFFNLDREDLWLVLAPNAETGFWDVKRISFDDPKIDFNANPEAGKAALRILRIARVSLYFERERNAPAPRTFDEIFDPACAVKLRCRNFALPNSRFYLPEEKAKRFDREIGGNAERAVSVEIFLRDDGTPVPKRLFVDGVEF